jgi:hypothetical protein
MIIVALLYFAPDRKLLNFVDYGSENAVRRLNRYAAVRLLLPVTVNIGCAYIAWILPKLTVPLLFLTPVSILCVVVWINTGTKQCNVKG